MPENTVSLQPNEQASKQLANLLNYAAFASSHFTDEKGNADGGQTFGPGFCIAWQRDSTTQNGAFITTIIEAVMDRLQFHQEGPHACPENAQALIHLSDALRVLNSRTQRRKEAGVEGTTAPG